MKNRPPGFDAALVAYLPQMRDRARRFVSSMADELLQDTVTMMLEKADQCRMETFRSWAQIMMLRASSEHRRRRNAEKRSAVLVPDIGAHRVLVEPNQEHYADLTLAVGILATIPGGDDVIAAAMGDRMQGILPDRARYEARRSRRQNARKQLMERIAA